MVQHHLSDSEEESRWARAGPCKSDQAWTTGAKRLHQLFATGIEAESDGRLRILKLRSGLYADASIVLSWSLGCPVYGGFDISAVDFAGY